MIRFSNWIISPQREVIARQHDNLTGRLEVLGDLPEGWIWDMLVRVGHYRDVLSLTPCDGGVGIDLSAEMLCVGGSYTMQLRGTQGELVRHTNQVTVYIPASLSGDEWWPELPSEFSQAEQRVRQCVEQATQEANRAEDGADAAQKDAEAAKGAANQAQQSAVAAQEANKGSEAAANQAKQSADQAAQKAAAAKETAWVAQEAARLAGQSAAAAKAARDGSEAAASRAGQSADQAAQKADAAASSASDAKKAQQAVENMTASAETLAPDAQASVTKTTQDDVVNLKFGIPQGQPGQNGGYYQPSVSEDGQLAFNPSQEDMPAVPSAYIKGPPGQDAPQIDDSRVSSATPWSSRQIVDTLAPEFEASGAVVTCTPVAGYPLHVVSQITLVQEGEGDPSPDNVRPIRGWDAANLWVGGKNLWDAHMLTNGEFVTYENREMFKYTDNLNAFVWPVPKRLRDEQLTFTSRFYRDDPWKSVTIRFSHISQFYSPSFPEQGVAYSYPTRPVYGPLESISGENNYNRPVYMDLTATQLELGASATNYEPYRGRTITLPFGQTVYGGELDWTTGVLSVDKVGVKITGAESITAHNRSTGDSKFFKAVLAVAPLSTVTEQYPTICNMATQGNPYQSVGDYCWALKTGVNELRIGFADQSIATPEQCKSFLANMDLSGTPYTVVYAIAEPFTIQLTPTEILALSGTNTIYADTGDTTVSGREDPLTVIQRLSERIAALEFNMNLLSDYQRGDMT